MSPNFDIVILGLSITSSWGNGHATTYRGLVRALHRRGYRILFLERDLPWYAGNRDQPQPEGAVTRLYSSVEEAVAKYEDAVSGARLVMLGSFVREGAALAGWITSVARGHTAFYDIDTPVTLARLESGGADYLMPDQVRRFSMYLSFTGGPALRLLEIQYRAPMARPFYCSADPLVYRTVEASTAWDLGYLGTYSPDRQAGLRSLLIEPAKHWPQGRFAVTGPMYPEDIAWPKNVDRCTHLSPREHAALYAAQRFTLNITRDEMKKTGFSPSVRLFEAGACGVPMISDYWDGLEQLFVPGKEILVAEDAEDSLRYLRDTPEAERRQLGREAQKRVLAEHTPEHRVRQLESYLKEADDNAALAPPRGNGRGREIDLRSESGVALERERQVASGAAGGSAGPLADPRHLYEPAGAGRGDSRSDRQKAPAGAEKVE